MMKTTLVEDDIQAYEEIIKQNREYVISHAIVKPVNEKYQTKTDELQMNFNNCTIIQPICDGPQDDAPQYHTISAVSRSAGPYDRFGM